MVSRNSREAKPFLISTDRKARKNLWLLVVSVIVIVIVPIVVGTVIYFKRRSASAADNPDDAAQSTPAASSTPAQSTPAQSTPAPRTGPIVDSTDDAQVLLGDAFTAAANFGSGYDVATENEVREHKPSKNEGNWHWVRTTDNPDNLVRMANYGSNAEPDWRFLTFQNADTSADYVYVIKR